MEWKSNCNWKSNKHSVNNEGDILSHEVELIQGDDYSQLFQSFDIFDDEKLSNLWSGRRKNESEAYNKNNNVFDNENIYLNLSNKMCALNIDDPDQAECNINLEVHEHKPKYFRQTTAKSGYHTGANITCADSNQK